MLKIILLFISFLYLYGAEPISPIPQESDADIQKAELGKILFFDPLLSRDGSVSCASCHDVFNGGADAKVVSIGYGGEKGNIQSPTVLNAVYNFKQFWNGRAKDLYEQAQGPLQNPVEHNMDIKSIEKVLNNSLLYKQKFKDVYDVSYIKFPLLIDAIVEFEKALITPNAKFDKYLRGELSLNKEEKEGYLLFKEYGCITCHNGVNVGGNSFQKMGVFFEYDTKVKYPDRYKITGNKAFINVFKVPTLRNISLTAPYFHDGSAKTLKEAINTMSKYSLGVELLDEEVEKMVQFLKILEGELPHILERK